MKLLAGLAVLSCFASAKVSAQTSRDSLEQIVEHAWQYASDQHRVPGAVVAIVRDSQVLLLRGFGFANIEDSVAANPETSVYRLASVAKLFVGAIMHQLVASGRMALDDPIHERVPDIPMPPGDGTITLRHLLTHTAGFDERVIGYAAPTREGMRPLGEYCRDRIPDRGWPAGQLVGYSNYGMALAAYAAQMSEGTRFDSLATARLFAPLGMQRTWYVAPTDVSMERDVAPAYRCGRDNCERRTTVWSHLYPIGLAFSTAADMARFMTWALNMPELMEQQFTHDDWLQGVATAFFLHSVNGHRVASHSGGAPGAASLLALLPDHRLGVFIATNVGESGFTDKMFRAIVDSLLPRRTPSLPVANGPVDEYAGSYLQTRYSHNTVERLPATFAFTMRAEAHGDTLLLGLGSAPRRFVRVDSLRLQEVGGDGRAVLTRDASGRIALLFTGLPAGGSELPAAFERVPWYSGARFLNEYVSWLVGLPMLVWVAWAVVAMVLLVRRRVKRLPRRAIRTRGGPAAIALGATHTIVTTMFVFGFLVALGRDVSAGTGLLFGMSTGKLLLLRLAWVSLLLAIPLALLAISAWRNKWWSSFGRVCYSLVAINALLTAHFIIWWNYVPGRW